MTRSADHGPPSTNRTMGFVHLHVHSSDSPLEGADGIESLVAAAREMGLSALALTDTNGLYGALRFYKAAKAQGMKPILGAEVVEKGGRRGSEGRGLATADRALEAAGRRAILLARDAEGYRSLCRIVTERHLSDRFDLVEALERCGSGLFVLASDPPLLERLRERLEPESLFVEIAYFGDPPDRRRIRTLLSLARGLDLSPVATNDVHFIEPSGYRIHRVLSAIRTRSTVATLSRGVLAHPQAWLKPPGAMVSLFREVPSALRSTVRIAEACNGTMEIGRVKFPPFPLPEGETPSSLLRRIAFDGLEERYRPLTRRALEQIEYELRVIDDLSFATYFLIVWDIVRHARKVGIPTVGRGSAANSLVCYALGITHVDPLRYGLYFERFLNPERKDCPDIDLDFPWNRRDEILRYVYETYGEDRVAMISTHIRFRGRSIVREVGKALGIPIREIDPFCRRIPCFIDLSDLERAREAIPEARDLPLEEEPFRTILRIGRRIEGHLRHLSVHCGGIVIAPGPITDFIPLQRAEKGLVVTQFDMYPVEDMGLVKIDLLGQRSLAVIVDTVEAVRRTHGREIDFHRIDPVSDPETRQLLREGRTMGCFYVESPGMRSLLRKLRVEDFDLLVAASSIIRPGVSDSGMMKAFIDRHNGREPVAYLHPKMEALLKETYGIMIYQEDVIKVAHHIAGMSLGEADALRKCMSKKRHWEAMETYRGRFLRGAMGNGVEERIALEIWRQIESFGGYAFCKAHSASFAQVSYRTAFLKAHYPAEFMAAVLSNQGGFYSTSAYIEEARRMGLRILPPDVNRSGYSHSAEPSPEGGPSNAVRVGLGQVKGLSRRSIEAICRGRKEGPYTSLPNLIQRSGIDFQEAEALIRCGALDAFGRNRPQLLWALESIRKGRKGQAEGLGGQEDILPFPWARPSLDPPVPLLPDYSAAEKMAAERETLGIAVTAHPLALYRERIRNVEGWIDAKEIGRCVGRRVRLLGWFVTSKRTRVKGGEFMKFLTLEDETAIFEVTLFPRVYRRFGHVLREAGPYVVTGRVEDDAGALTVTAERLEAIDLGGQWISHNGH